MTGDGWRFNLVSRQRPEATWMGDVEREAAGIFRSGPPSETFAIVLEVAFREAKAMEVVRL